MIINGVSAAYVCADANTPSKRPGSKAGPRIKKLLWDDATQEQRDTLGWIRGMDGKVYTFLSPTAEEQREMFLDKQYHKRQMLNYILEHYGLDVYNKVVESYKDEFDKVGVDTDVKLPHCKYAEGQCDLFCNYYRGGCRFVDTLDQTVVDM